MIVIMPNEEALALHAVMLDEGWQQTEMQAEHGVCARAYKRQGRGPFGRFRRNERRVLVFPAAIRVARAP